MRNAFLGILFSIGSAGIALCQQQPTTPPAPPAAGAQQPAQTNPRSIIIRRAGARPTAGLCPRSQ